MYVENDICKGKGLTSTTSEKNTIEFEKKDCQMLILERGSL